MPAVINQDGERLVWTAKYWQHHSIYQQEFDSLRDAAGFLEYGQDDGLLSPDSILGPDGGVLYDFHGDDSVYDLADRLRAEEARALPGDGPR